MATSCGRPCRRVDVRRRLRRRSLELIFICVYWVLGVAPAVCNTIPSCQASISTTTPRHYTDYTLGTKHFRIPDYLVTQNFDGLTLRVDIEEPIDSESQAPVLGTRFVRTWRLGPSDAEVHLYDTSILAPSTAFRAKVIKTGQFIPEYGLYRLILGPHMIFFVGDRPIPSIITCGDTAPICDLNYDDPHEIGVRVRFSRESFPKWQQFAAYLNQLLAKMELPCAAK